jgi:hypothetical protein
LIEIIETGVDARMDEPGVGAVAIFFEIARTRFPGRREAIALNQRDDGCERVIHTVSLIGL